MGNILILTNQFCTAKPHFNLQLFMCVLPIDQMYGFPFEIKMGNRRTFIGLGLACSSFELSYCRRKQCIQEERGDLDKQRVQIGCLKREFQEFQSEGEYCGNSYCEKMKQISVVQQYMMNRIPFYNSLRGLLNIQIHLKNIQPI